MVRAAQAQVRAIVEHPFHIIKNLFGYRKVSYRGIAKNQAKPRRTQRLSICTSPGADCSPRRSVRLQRELGSETDSKTARNERSSSRMALRRNRVH